MVTQHRERESNSGFNYVTETVTDALSQPAEMVREYPVSSMLVVFAAGLGVGVLVSQALLPEYQEPTFTKRMGRQLYEGMCNLSDAISRHV